MLNDDEKSCIMFIGFCLCKCVEENGMAKKKGKIERSIHYFDVTLQRLGREKEDSFVSYKNQGKKMLSVFKYFNELNNSLKLAKKKEDRLQILEDMEYTTDKGDKLYVEVDEINEADGHINFRLVLCRPDAFPYIEKEGKLEEIVGLVEGEFNIAEITHCVIFYKEGIMGAEFNFNGARPSAIAAYASVKCNKIEKFVCAPKLRGDTFERISDKAGYSLFQLKVKNTPDMKTFLRDRMGLIGSTINEIDDLDSYEIILRRRIGKKKLGFPGLMSKKDIQKFIGNNIEDIEKFEISQGIYRDPINLLTDKMITRKDFVMTKKKTINSSSMYEAIINFYENSVQKE